MNKKYIYSIPITIVAHSQSWQAKRSSTC